jgi:hypothetical protein
MKDVVESMGVSNGAGILPAGFDPEGFGRKPQ